MQANVLGSPRKWKARHWDKPKPALCDCGLNLPGPPYMTGKWSLGWLTSKALQGSATVYNWVCTIYLCVDVPCRLHAWHIKAVFTCGTAFARSPICWNTKTSRFNKTPDKFSYLGAFLLPPWVKIPFNFINFNISTALSNRKIYTR